MFENEVSQTIKLHDTYHLNEMKILQSLSRQINQNLSIKNVIKSTLEAVVNLLKVDLGIFFIREKDHLIIRGEKYIDPQYRHKDSIVHKVGECLCGLAIKNNQAQYSKNIHQDPRCTWNECKEAGLVSFAALPLCSNQQVIGVLGIAASRERDFRQQSVFFETLSNEISIGMNNAILYEQLKNHTDQLEKEIQNKKQTAKELIESENKYRRLTENSPDIIYRMSIQDKTYEYINPAVYQITGYHPDDYYQNPRLLFEIVHPCWKQYLSTEWQRLLSDNIPQEYEFQIIHKNGEHRWINQRNVIVKDNQGRPLVIEGIATDITERKRTEEALKESENRFRSISENAVDFIFIKDISRKYIFVNKAMRKLIGLPLKEILGKTPEQIFGKEQGKIINQIDERTFTGEIVNETRPIQIGNKTFYFNTIQTPLSVNECQVTTIMGIVRDVTQQKKTEQELKQKNQELSIAKEKAEESDKLKSAFLANMSHEIRTPMNGIIGFSKLLAEPGLNNEDRKLYTHIVINKSKQLLDIVNDILDISMIEANAIKLHFTPVNINQLIMELSIFFQKQTGDKPISIVTETALPDSRSIIKTDKCRLNQILTNLINNALKFTQSGKIRFGYEQIDHKIQFFVQDTGVGIDSELIDKIFDRFRHEELDIMHQVGGNGLGLSISQKLVQLLGGDIRVESSKHQGSTFYFTIPYSK